MGVGPVGGPDVHLAEEAGALRPRAALALRRRAGARRLAAKVAGQGPSAAAVGTPSARAAPTPSAGAAPAGRAARAGGPAAHAPRAAPEGERALVRARSRARASGPVTGPPPGTPAEPPPITAGSAPGPPAGRRGSAGGLVAAAGVPGVMEASPVGLAKSISGLSPGRRRDPVTWGPAQGKQSRAYRTGPLVKPPSRSPSLQDKGGSERSPISLPRLSYGNVFPTRG